MLTIPHNNIKQIDLIRIGNMPEHELSRKEALLNWHDFISNKLDFVNIRWCTFKCKFPYQTTTNKSLSLDSVHCYM